jgi:hypothetical protein
VPGQWTADGGFLGTWNASGYLSVNGSSEGGGADVTEAESIAAGPNGEIVFQRFLATAAPFIDLTDCNLAFTAVGQEASLVPGQTFNGQSGGTVTFTDGELVLNGDAMSLIVSGTEANAPLTGGGYFEVELDLGR